MSRETLSRLPAFTTFRSVLGQPNSAISRNSSGESTLQNYIQINKPPFASQFTAITSNMSTFDHFSTKLNPTR